MKAEGKNTQAEEVEQKTNKQERGHSSLISRVGQYTLETPLGEGGHAHVWQARGAYGGRVALKFVHPKHNERAQGQARLLHEAEMYRASGAPRGLASLLAVGDDAQLGPFLVLGLAEGPTLSARHLIFSVYDTLRTALHLCAVLRVLHRRGLVHGDIKPSNVIASASGAVLLDLSSAFLVGGGKRVPPGSWNTASPEQWRGDPSTDTRADVYSLGALLWWMLSGEFPPADVEAEELTYARQDVTPQLAHLLALCVRSNPTERPASVLVVQDEISRWFYLSQIASGGAWEAPPLPEAKKTIRAHWWIGAAAGLGLALCAYQLGRGTREGAQVFWKFPPQNPPVLIGTPLSHSDARPATQPAMSPNETGSENLSEPAPQTTKPAPVIVAETPANQYETALRALLAQTVARQEAIQNETHQPTQTTPEPGALPSVRVPNAPRGPRLLSLGEDTDDTTPNTKQEETP